MSILKIANKSQNDREVDESFTRLPNCVEPCLIAVWTGILIRVRADVTYA
jgi:hypothetical protein